MFRLFLAVVRRDLKLALRQKSDVLNTVFFFIVVVTLVPLGIGPDQQLLRMIAPGVVWVAALLAALLSLPRLFANDYADGTLEQMLLSGEPLTVIVIAKVFAHWLTTGCAHVRLTSRCCACHDEFALHRYAGAELSWQCRSCAHTRTQRRKRFNLASCSSPVYSCFDFRRRGCRSRRCRDQLSGLLLYRRRAHAVFFSRDACRHLSSAEICIGLICFLDAL